jgi:putative ATP-dependent endonuclease of OLD family
MLDEGQRNHTILAIEEPEAHLHPHLQRSVYRHMFANVGSDEPLSVFLTTHSPHIASVAPLRSILLLNDTESDGTVGRSTACLSLEDDEVDDLARYLDVTRAEILFARGVILVEGAIEQIRTGKARTRSPMNWGRSKDTMIFARGARNLAYFRTTTL